MESIGRSVRQLWTDPEYASERELKRFPDTSHWDPVRGDLLWHLFGDGAVGLVVPHAVKTWWGHTLSKYIEREKKAWQRQNTKIEQQFNKLEELLGKEFLWGSDDASVKFTVKQCLATVKVLRICIDQLSWDVLSSTDHQMLLTAVDPVTPTTIKAFDTGLSKQAGRHEHIARTLGWMTRMLVLAMHSLFFIGPYGMYVTADIGVTRKRCRCR